MMAFMPQYHTQEEGDQSYAHVLRFLILATVVSVFRCLARCLYNHLVSLAGVREDAAKNFYRANPLGKPCLHC